MLGQCWSTSCDAEPTLKQPRTHRPPIVFAGLVAFSLSSIITPVGLHTVIHVLLKFQYLSK